MDEAITWRVLVSLFIIISGIYIVKNNIKVKTNEFNNILLSFLSLFSLLSFFIFIFVHKISKRTQTLLDQDFTKPQAFHKEAIPRSGGIAAILSMITFSSVIIFSSKIFYQIIF